MDRQTTGAQAHPCQLILPALKAERGTGGEQRGKAEAEGKRGLAVPTAQQRGPRLAPLCFLVRPKATQNRLGGAEGQGLGRGTKCRRLRIFHDRGCIQCLAIQKKQN